MTYGFTVQASYTWSHAMDEISNGGIDACSTTAPPSIQYQINPTCLRCNNYGNADYDIRSYFSASYVWQTPWKFGNKYVNGAFGGWTISQNFFARTGLPYTVLDGFTAHRQLRSGHARLPVSTSTSTTAAATASASAYRARSEWLHANPIYNSPAVTGVALLAASPTSAATRIVDLGSLTPIFSVNKNFKLTERMAFGIGANFYNVFNHPNFTNPDHVHRRLRRSARSPAPRLRRPVRTDRSSPVCLRDASSSSRASWCSKESLTCITWGGPSKGPPFFHVQASLGWGRRKPGTRRRSCLFPAPAICNPVKTKAVIYKNT